MWESFKKLIGFGATAPQEDALSGLEMEMRGDSDLIAAFSDPNQMPPEVVMELIDTVVAGRPDAKTLREALALQFIKENGIDMYGTAIHDHVHNLKGHPDTNPDTLYVTPYARPTAGALVMPTYQTDEGEMYVALVKNWKDSLDHTQGVEEDWRFPGGYLEAYFPQDETQDHYDLNLDETAKREVKEELGLDLDVTPERMMVLDGTQLLPERASVEDIDIKRHPIDAFYLADLGRQHEAPPVRAGDDVALARWVNINDIAHLSGPLSSYSVTVDGKSEPFRPTHSAMLEKGIGTVRERIMPLHDHDPAQFESQLSDEATEHYANVAQAHGFPTNITININSGQSFADKVTASQRAETSQAVH